MSFGEILKQQRLERGWTKEYVSERTHLMTRIIDALETENFKRIAAPIYGKGYIQLYCDLLGIEAQPLLEDYLAQSTGEGGKKPVTRPAIRELPERPLEPIHTGARRTLPPKEPLTPPPSKVVTHKIVEPAEETFTAVPKPEISISVEEDTAAQPEPFRMPTEPAQTPAQAPVAPAPELELFPMSADPQPPAADPAVRETFTLTGDTLPPPVTPASVTPPPPPANPHRAIFSKAFEQEKRNRTIVPQRDRSDELQPAGSAKRNIFSPQQPVSEPANQALRPICDLFKHLFQGCANLVTCATRPKVKRLHGDEGRYVTPRMLYQALLIFVALLTLTGLIFVFRYVFRISDAAESEYGLLPDATQYESRPVATPPDPFFD